ncbi:MAG: tyrosine-type recombinase/integrase [Egibacteraceae bacterium]
MRPDTGDIVSDLPSLVISWRRHLRAANLSPRTVASYTEGAQRYLDYATEAGLPTTAAQIQREHIEEFIGALLDRGQTASTVATRYRGLQQLFRWLEEEGEVDRSPMARMRPPKVPEQPVPVLDEDTLRALLHACDARDFEARRDTAIIRLFIDTGARLAEVAGLRYIPDDEFRNDVDLDAGLLRLLGKGRRERVVRVGAKSVKALDRCLRLRDRHPHAETEHVWLGGKGRFTGSGIAQMLRRRSRQAGIPEVHPHQFRHTFAHCWLSEGGSEGDLMRLAGWKSRAMLSATPPPPPPNAPARHIAGSPPATACRPSAVSAAGLRWNGAHRRCGKPGLATSLVRYPTQVITSTSRGFYTAQPSVRRLATVSGDRTSEHTLDRASIWVGKLDVPGGFEGVELSAVQSVERVGVSRVEQNEPVGGNGVAQNLPKL